LTLSNKVCFFSFIRTDFLWKSILLYSSKEVFHSTNSCLIILLALYTNIYYKSNLPSSNTNIAINKKARIGINYTIYLNPKPCKLIMSINRLYSIWTFYLITRTLAISLSCLCSNAN
jgi:hypothetical protein